MERVIELEEALVSKDSLGELGGPWRLGGGLATLLASFS